MSLKVGAAVSKDALQPEIDGVPLGRTAESGEVPASPNVPVNWAIGWVPEGFRLADASTHDGAKKGVHVMFSDGLATFSVFAEPAPRSPAGGVFSRSGATVLLSHDLAANEATSWLQWSAKCRRKPLSASRKASTETTREGLIKTFPSAAQGCAAKFKDARS